jgi:hypothetical protein
MPYRILVAAVVATALLASGCSSSKPTVPSPAKSSSAQASASASATAKETTQAEPQAPAETLDGNACVDVTGANLDLATATNHDDARKAGDTFEKYNPPADVREAIEHFVGTNGAQFDDPNYDKYNKTIDDWVKQVCPLGG